MEWALRFYNQTNPTRHSRLSFYSFSLGSPAGEGNGSYMVYGVSSNDETGTDKLTGFHAALSNGGVGSNIQAK